MKEDNELIKGRKLPLGTVRSWSGKEYEKTAAGWKPRSRKDHWKKRDEENLTLDQGINRKNYNLLKEIVGDKFTDQQIDSVLSGLAEGDDLTRRRFKYKRSGTSMEKDEDSKDEKVDQIFEHEIMPGMWHKDLEDRDVKDIIYGIVTMVNDYTDNAQIITKR